MQRLFRNIIQQFLELEMEEHLGREKYERDGVKRKTIETDIVQRTLEQVLGMLM